MSRASIRRPSVSIYDYPEDLNPFKDEENNDEVVLRKPNSVINNNIVDNKESKNKFWTFGRSRKKRSNSFSIKSTWNGIFGKRKDVETERKPTISTVSSSYNRATYNNPPEVTLNRVSKDQQEFDEALGTLARRRKYTFDNNSSRYSSSLTVNGDPGRIYDGCPQDTTLSIMGELTPKPPVRRFGQVSSKPTDEIPPLNYGDCEFKCDEEGNRTPVPPKRGTLRSTLRLTHEDVNSSPRKPTLPDENENIPEDYVFKRFSTDAVRKSNLSINSCISTGSVYHSGRKKRRAPQPPTSGRTVEVLQSTRENSVDTDDKSSEIAAVASDITILTETIVRDTSPASSSSKNDDKSNNVENLGKSSENNENSDDCDVVTAKLPPKIEKVDVELRKSPDDSRKIIKNIEVIENSDDEVTLRNNEHHLSSENFSVREEIEKIERQIKILEGNEARRRTSSFSNDDFITESRLERGGSRRSLQENRRHFFRELTRPASVDSRVKIEIKELPREQNDIKIVHLNSEPIVEPKKPVKVIELHISEPIKQKPEFTSDLDINPIPKPRRMEQTQEFEKVED